MVTVHYFGEIADQTGCKLEKIHSDSMNLSALIKQIVETHHLDASDFKVAINHELVSTDQEITITEMDEIALLSAFAGG